MNLLQSLAMRTLDTVVAIEPPRVPFVSVFPVENGGAPDAGAGIPPAAQASREDSVSATPGRDPGPAPEPVIPRARTVERTVVSPSSDRVPEPRSEPTHDVQPTMRPVERVLEQRIEIPSRTDVRPAPARPIRHDAAEDGSQETPITREVHHTHHHHWLERRVEPVVQEVERIAAAPQPVIREIEPRPAPRAAQPPTITASPDVPVAPGLPTAGRAEEQRIAAVPAGPPVVNVTIGRVTVRLQAPAVPARSETTRPVAPSVGLDAYSTARRRRTR